MLVDVVEWPSAFFVPDGALPESYTVRMQGLMEAMVLRGELLATQDMVDAIGRTIRSWPGEYVSSALRVWSYLEERRVVKVPAVESALDMDLCSQATRLAQVYCPTFSILPLSCHCGGECLQQLRESGTPSVAIELFAFDELFTRLRGDTIAAGKRELNSSDEKGVRRELWYPFMRNAVKVDVYDRYIGRAVTTSINNLYRRRRADVEGFVSERRSGIASQLTINSKDNSGYAEYRKSIEYFISMIRDYQTRMKRVTFNTELREKDGRTVEGKVLEASAWMLHDIVREVSSRYGIAFEMNIKMAVRNGGAQGQNHERYFISDQIGFRMGKGLSLMKKSMGAWILDDMSAVYDAGAVLRGDYFIPDSKNVTVKKLLADPVRL